MSRTSTEIELKKGDMVLFHRRMAMVVSVSRNGKVVWGLEHTDGGGRTRKFKPFMQSDIVRFPSILDVLATAGESFPVDELDERALRAELWFTDPQVGDILASADALYFLKITHRCSDILHVKIQSSSEVDREQRIAWVSKGRSFSSIEDFQKRYQLPYMPGYELFAWSSNRDDGQDRIDIPEPIGEVK